MSRILYIEDDEQLRESGEKLLKLQGHSVITREDTNRAESLADLWKPHLVITDHELGAGKETGLELAVRLKKDGINVVMLSGCPTAYDEAMILGIPFFMKPYSMLNLVDKMVVDEDNSEQMVLPMTGRKKGSSE